MLRSKRSLEGYLLRDDGSGHRQEVPTYTCAHCHYVVVMNPLRTRAREWCSGCDRYICDGCGAIKKIDGLCQSRNALLDKLQEQAAKAAGS